MKVSLFAFGVLFVCVCIVAQADFVDFLSVRDGPSDLKDTFTGLAAAVGGSINTDNIYNCGFDPIADNLVTGIKDLINEASGCNPSKVSDIQAKLQTLLASIPESIGVCLQTSSDAQAFLNGLHVLGKSPQQIQDAVTSWITNNPLTACWDLQGLASSVNSGNMKQFGSDGGAILIEIFTSKKNVSTLRASKDHFTQMLTGIASNVQDTVDVNSIASCSDEPTYVTIEAALLPIIDEAASCDPTKLDDIGQKVTALVNGLPDSAKQCLNTNTEGQKLLNGLGILGLTPAQIQSKVTNYVLSHVFSLCGTVGNLNKKLKAGDFNGFGTDVGKIALDIFKNSAKSNKQIAQEAVFALLISDKTKVKALDSFSALLGGVASVVAKGADTQTTAKCTDEPTAGNVISTIADLIKKGSTCDLTKASELATKAKALVDSIPAGHKQCFNNDSGAKKIASGLGIAGASMDKIVQKVLVYAIGHFSDICNSVKVLDSDASSSNWNQFGVDSAKLLQRMLA
jgi:hypothetical protein